MTTKRNAWVCDTAYQLLNALNYVWNHNASMAAKESAVCVENDLYLGMQFFRCGEMLEQLKKENVFTHIHSYKTRAVLNKKPNRIQQILEIVCPITRIRRMLDENENFKIPAYDTIYMSMPTHFSAALVHYTKCPHVIFFDDGIGSYSGNVSKETPKAGRLHRLLGQNPDHLKPELMLLNNPSFCTKPFTKVEALPAFERGSELFAVLERVFQYTNDGYYEKHPLIYLSQPMGEINKNAPIFEKAVNEQLTKCGNSVLMRLHPREKNKKIPGLNIDDHRDMWELAVINQITDDHVLISTYSTSQLIPKMFCDKEPTLVFLYRLYDFLRDNQDMKDMVDLVKKSYRDQTKIKVIETMEELEALVEETQNGFI